MRNVLVSIDQVLRGTFTRRESLSRGEVGISFGVLLGSTIALGAIYGLFMGLYGILRTLNPTPLQLLASVAKIPLLFILTLGVTFPSLYVFSALLGSPLRFSQCLRLLLIGIVVNLALLASFGPVVGFFTLSTESYPFMVVLNVVFCGVAGIAGLIFMYRALDAALDSALLESRDSAAEPTESPGTVDPDESSPSEDAPAKKEGGGSSIYAGFAPASRDGRGRILFAIWMVIYGCVGAQMGWVLRPFIGHPNIEFSFFRERTSNFFEAILIALRELLTS